MKDNNEQKWVSVLETEAELEAEIVADRLKDAGIPAVVMKRQEKFIGTIFTEQKLIQVLVQPERLEEAKDLLNQQPLSDEELERAALNAGKEGEEG